MKYSDLDSLENLLLIEKDTVANYFSAKPDYEIRKGLSYFENRSKLIRLKRGVYITEKTYEDIRFDNSIRLVIGCQLKVPSYLSRDYVLQKHNVLTEATYGYSLVTTKTRSTIINKVGTFTYSHITPKLFTGYNVINTGKYEYYEATKAKALFDWFYFRKDAIKITELNFNLVEDFRLNLDEFTKSDFRELKKYATLANNKKITKIILNIIHHASNN